MTQQQFKVNLKLKLIKASFLLNVGDDFADPSKQAFKKPTKDSTPSRFTICTISSEFNFMIFIYAVVQFYPWFNFNFPLFLGMVMYGNETKDKIEPQHFHQNDVGKLGRGWRRKVSSIYSNSCPAHLFLLFFNWFLADLVKVIGVAVHTSKSRKVKKSDYWQLGKRKPWQKKPTDISG